MSRLQTVRENWTEITTKLLRDKQELAHFLRFSAKMYKQSFSDAVLIYQQNPNATKVATLETWNRLGRLVNKGEHSIAVFGEDSKCKHLFDISQTNGKRVPELWKLTEDLFADLTAVINEKYGKDCKNIKETIAAVAVDNIKSRLPDMQYAVGQMKLSEKDITAYQQSVVSAVRFVIANRCELDSEMKISGGINLNAADMFKDSRDLIRFCNIVNQSAKDTLLEMKREIVNILKQRRERSNDIQIKFDRTVSSRNPVYTELQRTGASEKADRQVGQNVAGVGENGVSQRGSDIRDGGSLEHNTEGNRQRSGETLSGDGRTVSTAEPPSDSVQRDTDLGENKSADDRTQDNGGNRVQAQNVAVQNLIDRFLHADFNRRLDSYETAGMVFMDYADTSFDPVQFFDRFHSDRFSDTQAEEIRNIIKAAMQSREYVPKLVTELTDIQNYDLEQFEIFRSPVTHDVNGYYADDLAEGDTVKLDGELWTVKSAVTYSISLVNDSGEKNINNSPESKWQETITKAGFEFVSEKALEISEPVFAEPEPFLYTGRTAHVFRRACSHRKNGTKVKAETNKYRCFPYCSYNGYGKSRPAWRKCRAEKP